MKMWIDFRDDKDPCDDYYDLYEDYSLIEASFAQQYGIRLRQEDDMSWNEFCTLLSGIMPETPLGRIVSIRAEKDRSVIDRFTPEQKKIYNDWKMRCIRKRRENPAAYAAYVAKFQAFCRSAFGK